MANHFSHAALSRPIRKARFTFVVPYLDTTGAPTDPTTPDTEISKDAAGFADCAEEVTTIGSGAGTGYLTLSGAEMDCAMAAVQAKVASGPNTTLASLYPADLPIVSSGTLSAGSAGGGTLGTVLPYNIAGCFIRTTGGTGGGGTGGADNQARKIMTYDVSTGAFTVTPNWETTPSTDTTYDILLPEGMTLGALKALNPTAAGATLDVTATGEAGVDWGNVGSPTTTVNLSGTSTKAVEPTVAGRTLGVASTGQAGIDLANINVPVGAIPALGIVDNGTAAGFGAAMLQLRAGATFEDDALIGATLYIVSATTGAGQRALILANDESSDEVTVDPWPITLTGTVVYVIFASPKSSASAPVQADVTKWLGTTVATPGTAGVPSVDAVRVSTSDTAADNLETAALAYSATRGLAGTALPDAAADAAGGLPISDAGGLDLDAEIVGIADQVWDEDLSGHAAAGSAGEALSAAAVGGDPLAVDVPGAYTGIQAGKVLGDIAAQAAKLNFDGDNALDANIKKIADTEVVGDGSSIPWGPV